MTATLRPRRIAAPAANRLLAAGIDLTIVAVAPVATVVSVAERFRLVDPSAGTGRFGPGDQLRIDEIGRGFNQAIEWNGWLYTVDGAGLMATLGALAAAAMTVMVLFPLATGGRSPGKGLTGLRVVAADGRRATAGQHLLRTLAGPVDLLPFVLPGLVGVALASADADRRRYGDRLADTRVTRLPSDWVVRAPAGRLGHRPEPTDGRYRPELPVETAAEVAPADRAPSTEPTPEPCALIAPRSVDVVVGRARNGPPAVAAPSPPLPPTRRSDGSATRSPRSRQGAIGADIDLVGERTTAAGRIGLGDEADYDHWGHQPAVSAGSGDRQGAATSRSQPFDDLLLPESSLAEGSLLATVRDVAGPAPAGSPAGGEDSPMWDELRMTWVYRQRSSGRWYHHDVAGDRWLPIVTE